MPGYPTGRRAPAFLRNKSTLRPCRTPPNVARAGKPRVRLRANKKYRDSVTIVSFKSKYIAVAVAAAIAVSLAVGSVMVYENRSQHAALLDTASADARSRVLGELTLRAGEVARHVVRTRRRRRAAATIATDHERRSKPSQRDDTLLGVVLRDTAGKRALRLAAQPATTAAASRAAPSRRCAPTCRPCRAS